MAGSERPFGLAGPLGPWRPLDAWVAGYALLAAAVAGLGAARGAAGCRLQAAVALAVAAGALALARGTRASRARPALLLRLFYGPLLYLVLYRQVAVLWPVLRPAPLDGLLVALEARLWGTQPALAFQAALPWRGLSELFCFAYFAYYLFVPAVGLTLLGTRGYLAAERYIRAVTICFLGCYALFWLLPTVGPHYWFPPGRGPGPYRGYLFNHLLQALTARGEIRGGAFPSSHVAVAVLTCLQVRRPAPALFPPLVLLTLLMLPAVVYLRAHYLVDVPAGMLTGLLIHAWTRERAGEPDIKPTTSV